ENLVSVRLVSGRTEALLFDSEAESNPSVMPADTRVVKPYPFPDKVLASLKKEDWHAIQSSEDRKQAYRVYTGHRSESGERLCYLEYVFAFRTLAATILRIQNQLMIDLAVSLVLGLGIAALFAQFLLRPIRRLVQGVQQVGAGNYDVE